MERELLNPAGVHPPQAHYSHVGRVGNTLYISGQLAMDRSGALVGAGDARAQARQCYDNLAAILAHYGGSLRHLTKTTTYITHWAYRAPVAAARDEVFPAPPYPANTLVVVAGLAEPHFLVEIEAIAVLD
ncbi:MAG: RidA family protein [Candidatus Rokuibacteriota bacterium]